jgi:hypothetical protein
MGACQQALALAVVVVVVVAVFEVHGRTCTCYHGYNFLFEKHNKLGPGYWAAVVVEGLLGAAHACGELQGLAFAALPPCYPRRYAKICIRQYRIFLYRGNENRCFFEKVVLGRWLLGSYFDFFEASESCFVVVVGHLAAILVFAQSVCVNSRASPFFFPFVFAFL